MTQDLSILYVVATSHLDTQWRWTFQDTIKRYLPLTLRENFTLFEEFPDYVFSFEGAFRYMMAKEYYPEEHEVLKKYIQRGNWRVCGSSIDAGDVNTVSPESLIRQILYGNGFFKHEYGKVSSDIFLPDCFGFGWALPSIAFHCGLKGFSTSKLEWGSSEGIPFNVGFWEGVNGDGLIAAINPGQYSFPIKTGWFEEEKWLERIARNKDLFGAGIDFKYFGLGDTGGAPDRDSVQNLFREKNSNEKVEIRSSGADQLFDDLSEDTVSRLPRHSTEFLLIEHGAGTFTSHGELKRWNRKNELLAKAAEAAAVMADIQGVVDYPHELLKKAWILFLANQMHDILPGTSIPEAYPFTWNDHAVASNIFYSTLKTSLQQLVSGMKTDEFKTPFVAFNPSGLPYEGVVELPLCSRKEIVSDKIQIVHDSQQNLSALASVKLKPLELRAFGLEESQYVADHEELKIDNTGLENGRYKVSINEAGDISQIFDKTLERNLMKEPIRIEMLDQAPQEWPAWTIEYGDLMKDPLGSLSSKPEIEIKDSGPLRISLQIVRREEGFTLEQLISLEPAQFSPLVRVYNKLTWERKGTLLKARFSLSPGNEKATYDLGLGVIQRGNNHEKLHEVPAQGWVSLVDDSEEYGVAVLSDCKYGWDKPDDHTLRLTLIHTPRLHDFHVHLGGADFTDYFSEQAELDFGVHEFSFAVMGHSGDWKSGQVPDHSVHFEETPVCSLVPRHSGELGDSLKLIDSIDSSAKLTAVKKSEDSEGYIFRLFEKYGKQNIPFSIKLDRPVHSVEDLNGFEEKNETSSVDSIKNSLSGQLSAYEIKTAKLHIPKVKQVSLLTKSMDLPWNCRGYSPNKNRQDGDLTGSGISFPAELVPEVIHWNGVPFQTGPRAYHENNVLVPNGQRIKLPEGDWKALHLLVGSVNGDTLYKIGMSGSEVEFKAHDLTAPVGKWYNRFVDGTYVNSIDECAKPYLNEVDIAHFVTHLHCKSSNSDLAYQYGYFFCESFSIESNVKEITLPKNSRIRVFALSLSSLQLDFKMKRPISNSL